MKLLKDYFELQKQIFNYFGYVEDWVAIPLNDLTDVYWHLTGEDSGKQVFYSPDKSFNEDCLYSNYIYTQCFLPKWVYRGKDYTMICGDTRCDGNKFLQIFDNKKEIKEMPEICKQYI